MEKGAYLSECGLYRYSLWRIWDERFPVVVFIMLNPSTADADLDDPTIRRCMAFARVWGCGGIVVVNLFAYRATEPRELKTTADPVGPDNDVTLYNVCDLAPLVVCAWGAYGDLNGRAKTVKANLRQRGIKLHYLRLTGKGEPSHPLYLPGTLTPTEWSMENRDRLCA